jgi:hypothetical protein
LKILPVSLLDLFAEKEGVHFAKSI